MKNSLNQAVEEYFELRHKMREIQKHRPLTEGERFKLRAMLINVHSFYGIGVFHPTDMDDK